MSIVSPKFLKYRAIIFDMDGTLLDTIEDIAAAMNRVLAARSLPTFDVEAYKTLVGEGAEELVRKVFGRRPPNESQLASALRDYRREYELCWRSHSRPYPGIPELLRELARRRVRTAVLSNKPQAFTEVMAEEILAPHAFAVVRGAAPGVPLKPDPAPALAIASELDVPPASIVFLGDTKIDIKTAAAAGMLPVGALWGFRTADELRASGAAALAASPLDLLPYFPAA